MKNPHCRQHPEFLDIMAKLFLISATIMVLYLLFNLVKAYGEKINAWSGNPFRKKN